MTLACAFTLLPSPAPFFRGYIILRAWVLHYPLVVVPTPSRADDDLFSPARNFPHAPAPHRFDQVCINLANEQLHFFFNQHIFAAEMGSYADEGLDTVEVLFSDNKAVLNFFLDRPLGMLNLLDEEASLPKGTDRSLMTKVRG